MAKRHTKVATGSRESQSEGLLYLFVMGFIQMLFVCEKLAAKIQMIWIKP